MTDTHDDPSESATTETRELTVSRVIEAPRDRVYEAFLDPEELAQWMHPGGFSAEVHHLDPEEGGTYRITMRGEAGEMSDHSHSYGGTFEELVPGERIVQREVPEAPGMDGEMTVTIEFDEVPAGTDVTVRIEMPAHWPDEAIGGWADALENLDVLLSSA